MLTLLSVIVVTLQVIIVHVTEKYLFCIKMHKHTCQDPMSSYEPTCWQLPASIQRIHQLLSEERGIQECLRILQMLTLLIVVTRGQAASPNKGQHQWWARHAGENMLLLHAVRFFHLGPTHLVLVEGIQMSQTGILGCPMSWPLLGSCNYQLSSQTILLGCPDHYKAGMDSTAFRYEPGRFFILHFTERISFKLQYASESISFRQSTVTTAICCIE